MRLISDGFDDGAPIPARLALAEPDTDAHVTFAGNRSPHLAWDGVPGGTRSFALTCIDPDAPSRPDDVNQEDREVPADLPRTDFVHWALIDLPADTRSLEEGAFSDGVVARGKREVDGPLGTRCGVNDYTGWFAGDETMAGTYRGYDGPGPPWNDALVHRYVFTIYALDVSALDVAPDFTAADIATAIAGHVLADATLTGTYTLNPRLLT